MESMFDLIDQKPKVQDWEFAKDLRIKNGDIEFKNVNFGYDSGRPILKDLSFKIPGGKSVAFVGPTGSGKSTILKLIMRLYDPTLGKVIIDGQNVSMVTQTSLRELLTIVPQESLLFNDSIQFNIRYGRLTASEREISQAAKLSQLHHIINQMPNKYQTIVGERGQRLSGGEKQRLSFARAILKQSPIMLLDEATSSLDQITEQKIQQALRLFKGTQTTVMIAHRLSTVKDVDMIVVLKEGRIVESGTHNELIRSKNLYYNLWNQQNAEYQKQQSLNEGLAVQNKAKKLDCFNQQSFKNNSKQNNRLQQLCKQRHMQHNTLHKLSSNYGAMQQGCKTRLARKSSEKRKYIEQQTPQLLQDLIQNQRELISQSSQTSNGQQLTNDFVKDDQDHKSSLTQNNEKFQPNLLNNNQSKTIDRQSSEVYMNLLQQTSGLQTEISFCSQKSSQSSAINSEHDNQHDLNRILSLNSEQDNMPNLNKIFDSNNTDLNLSKLQKLLDFDNMNQENRNSLNIEQDFNQAQLNENGKENEKSAAELLFDLVQSQRQQPSQQSTLAQSQSNTSREWDVASSNNSTSKYYDNTSQNYQNMDEDNVLEQKKILYYLLQNKARLQPQSSDANDIVSGSIHDQKMQSSSSSQDLDETVTQTQNDLSLTGIQDQKFSTYKMFELFFIKEALKQVQQEALNLQKSDQQDQPIYSCEVNPDSDQEAFFRNEYSQNSSNG